MNELRTPAENLASYRRGGRSRVSGSLYRVSGESLPLDHVARRLRVSESAARHRIQRLRERDQPLTWEALA